MTIADKIAYTSVFVGLLMLVVGVIWKALDGSCWGDYDFGIYDVIIGIAFVLLSLPVIYFVMYHFLYEIIKSIWLED